MTQIDVVEDKAHWEDVYATRQPDTVSWFQSSARLSLELIQRVVPDRDAPIIDVGGGTSVLVDELQRAGYRDVTVLDIAANALAATRARLGAVADRVHWLEADVRTASLPGAHYAVWHDRAVFHFLTVAADRAEYVAQVERAVRPGGYVVVATFAENGPTSCSGLPVARYSPEALHAAFGEAFTLVARERESHETPSGASQSFIYCAFRRAAEPASHGDRT